MRIWLLTFLINYLPFSIKPLYFTFPVDFGLNCTIVVNTTYWERKFNFISQDTRNNAILSYRTNTCEQLAKTNGEIIYNYQLGIFPKNMNDI